MGGRALTPSATAEQARELDRASGRHGVDGMALMALASFQCARLARLLLQDLPPGTGVAVLAGRGNNGGDALGCARHLASWGRRVRALSLATLEDPGSVASRQAHAAAAAGVEIRQAEERIETDLEWALDASELVVDGLLGTGASGAPRGPLAIAIERANRTKAKTLAIDIPSGLDASSGGIPGICIRASATLMLAVAKTGCLRAPGRGCAGQLWLADIGVPATAYAELGLKPPDFSRDSLVPLLSSQE